MKPCPFCGAMLTAALVDRITDFRFEESCPRRPKRARRVEALIDALEIVPGELAAKRMVALAQLGASVRSGILMVDVL